MKIAIIIIGTFIIAGIIGFIGGRNFSFLNEETLNELDQFTERIEELNKNSYTPLVKNSSTLISILRSLEEKNEKNAKELIINELGDTYYVYTHEDERALNSNELETILVSIDELSKKYPSFLKIKQYKRTE